MPFVSWCVGEGVSIEYMHGVLVCWRGPLLRITWCVGVLEGASMEDYMVCWCVGVLEGASIEYCMVCWCVGEGLY